MGKSFCPNTSFIRSAPVVVEHIQVLLSPEVESVRRQESGEKNLMALMESRMSQVERTTKLVYLEDLQLEDWESTPVCIGALKKWLHHYPHRVHLRDSEMRRFTFDGAFYYE